MNLWHCEHRHPDGRMCTRTARGEGGAVGLLAIGWFFRPGRPDVFLLLCPDHHPDGLEAAYAQADRLQAIIKETTR